MLHPLETIALDGGWLALDFINTVSGRNRSRTEDYLGSWDDFIVWVRRLHILEEREFDAWRQLPAVDPAEVRGLRETLYALFRHHAEHGRIDPDHLTALNAYLHEVYVHTLLRETENGLVRTVEESPHPEKPLWLIALSAEALLLSDKVNRVKACANTACGWLFLDTSKNGARRWCNMQSCGSQDKAKNYYHRKKEQGGGD